MPVQRVGICVTVISTVLLAAVPALIDALTDRHESVRRLAIGALGKIGSDAKSAVPALVEFLRDNDHSVRLLAILALARLDQNLTRLCRHSSRP